MSGKRRILAIDDDALFLTVLHDQLSAAGDFLFEGLSEAAQAVPRAASFSPHLILVDRNMPVLSGSEVLRALHAFPLTAGVPVAFFTAESSERDLLRALRSGAIDVMRKPFEPGHVERLRSLLDELATARPSPRATSNDLATQRLLALYRRERRDGRLLLNPGTPFEGIAEFEQGTLKTADFGPAHGVAALTEMMQVEDGVWRFESSLRRTPAVPVQALPDVSAIGFTPRVLVVDDDPELRRLFKTQLARAGFEVEVADDGNHGVDAVRENPFDLVIADLNMPHLDGWGMLRQLKSDLRSRETPLVFLSAQDDYRETLKAARSGAHDYLAKTGRSEDVVQRAQALVAPRAHAYAALRDGKSIEIHTQQVGPQWLLKMAGQLKSTGSLELRDDWATYTVWIRNGSAVDARATWPKRQASGLPAIAAMLVARNAEGSFEAGEVEGDPRLFMTMDALLDKTVGMVNQLEARVTTHKLAATTRFIVDEILYDLYRQIGPEQGIAIARALCEERVRPTELAAKLSLPPEDVFEGLRELLRRGVIAFQDA